MFSSHQSMHTSQNQLFVNTNLSSFETVHTPVRSRATFIWDIQLEREQVLEAVLFEGRVHPQEASVAGPELPGELLGDPVDRVHIERTGQSVVLVPGTQAAARPRPWEAPDEVYAPDTPQTVEIVVFGDVDLVTVGVFKVEWTFTAFFRVISV